MTQVEGTFKIMGWEESAYDEAAGLPKLMRAQVCEELQGGIVGEASVSYLMGYGTNGVASFIGLARVVGAVGERSGSFVMQDVGTFENGLAKGRWTILPGLSTGELQGIRGHGHFAANEDSVSYLLDVDLP
jgi:hypothetical protein